MQEADMLCKRASSERKLKLLDQALKKKEEAAEKEKLSQEQENNIENKKKRLKLMQLEEIERKERKNCFIKFLSAVTMFAKLLLEKYSNLLENYLKSTKISFQEFCRHPG